MTRTFEPVLLRAPVECDTCGIPTLWRTPRQTKFGRCLDHIPGLQRSMNRQGERLVRSIIRAAFPDTTITYEWTPPVYRRGEYPRWVRVEVRGRWLRSGVPAYARSWALPDDAGPCDRCGYTIRRYGDLASPLCYECLQETK